jgi:teichuronic acid biosynthesis glycosyltransferase TuaH
MSEASRWDGLIVVCAGTRWSGIRMSEHHIADRLTAWAPVLYVDPPTSILKAYRNPALETFPQLRDVRPGLARLTPVVLPASRRPGVVRVTEELTRLQIRLAIRKLGGRASVRILASDLPVYERRGNERRVLFATDDFSAGSNLGGGVGSDQILRHETRLALESDLVIAISEPIAEKWRAAGCTVMVVPNGCDAERFAQTDAAPWPDDVHLRPPIAGFTGQINERLDLPLLEAVAARGHSLLLVGPVVGQFDVHRLAPLLSRPNVQWVGAKPFEAMPSYLRVMHVGLTPYSNTPFNRASFPLKTIEYLAAGRAVVSVDLPAARWLNTEHLTLTNGTATFVEAVEARFREPLGDAVVTARRRFAAGHSWSVRARQFAEAIGISVPTISTGRESVDVKVDVRDDR